MDLLPKGVTGFDAPDHEVPLNYFTAACQVAALQAAGRVQQVRAAYERVTPNFHEVLIKLPSRPELVRVLCNAHYPIVTFAAPAAYEGDVRLDFMDCPELVDALRTDFSIITRQGALAGVADQAIEQLGEAELHNIRYWRPQRIGDVIFNYWD